MVLLHDLHRLTILPRKAFAQVSRLHLWGTLQDHARTISNTAYQLGSLMLELSYASANLVQAARGNSGPLLSAQTGFLSSDGTHAHVSNRVPSLPPFGGLGRCSSLWYRARSRGCAGRQDSLAPSSSRARGGERRVSIQTSSLTLTDRLLVLYMPLHFITFGLGDRSCHSCASLHQEHDYSYSWQMRCPFIT